MGLYQSLKGYDSNSYSLFYAVIMYKTDFCFRSGELLGIDIPQFNPKQFTEEIHLKTQNQSIKSLDITGE